MRSVVDLCFKIKKTKNSCLESCVLTLCCSTKQTLQAIYVIPLLATLALTFVDIESPKYAEHLGIFQGERFLPEGQNHTKEDSNKARLHLLGPACSLHAASHQEAC